MIRPLLVTAGAAGLLAMGVTRQTSLDGRVAHLEHALQRRTQEASAVHELEARLDADAAALRAELSVAEGRAIGSEEQARILAEEVAALRAELAAAEGALASQRQALQTLESQSARLDEIEAGADAKLARLVDTMEATAHLVTETRDQLERVESRVETDTRIQWRSMVAPTVQLAGETTVGSGVLLPSRPLADDPSRFRTLLLTSWHVVRDIRADAKEENCPIPVILRDEHGNKTDLTARLVAHDVPLDAALLELDVETRLEHGAQLPTRDGLRAARVFDPVVAVGCPLGNDPIPTEGHVSDLHHRVSGERFWMISAPTYIGNSGGGIYSRGSRELVGIFSKIYTHGAIRPTVIPHMGLVTPLEEFYDWIDSTGVARVIESADGAAVVLAE